ncbi:MAG: histidine--tRNA ligase [Candidatus Caldarchaeum sp.]|uniref:Histidine--tRNA ligase n=1 Tax=Caldiarchaeum subterraneum TaxID=311458 RepID=A0A7J3VTH1_CALS0
MKFDTPRGMDDLLPEEFAVKQKVVDVIREVYKLYGYQEVETPTLEYLELFEAKSGDEIRHRMYVFTDVHGKRLVLRPEVTASIARLVATKLSKQPTPLRLGYIADCYRYDEPQWGRRRRFWHGGFELFGSSDPSSDAEIILASRDVFARLGIDSFSFRIGHVGVLRGLLEKMETKLQDKFLSMVDRGMREEAFKTAAPYLDGETLECLHRLSSFKGGYEVLKQASDLVSSWKNALRAVENLAEVVDVLREVDKALRFELDLGFARGLEYYTGMIFEQRIEGEELSFNGGGRYDGLVELFGGGRMPAVGCSVGITRLSMYLRGKRRYELEKPPTAALAIVSDDSRGYAAYVADFLRRRGCSVVVDVSRKKLPDVIENTSAKDIRYLIIVGSRERESERVSLRDLATRQQAAMSLEEAARMVCGK